MEQQLFCCCKIQCLHTSKVHSTIHFAYTKRAGFIDGRGMAYDMSCELGYVYCLFRIGKVQEQLPQKQNIGINGELELYVVHIFDIQLITKSHCVLGLILIISDIGYISKNYLTTYEPYLISFQKIQKNPEIIQSGPGFRIRNSGNLTTFFFLNA